MSELPLLAAIVRAGNTVVVKCTSHPSSQILVTVVMSFRPTCFRRTFRRTLRPTCSSAQVRVCNIGGDASRPA
jgi:hypothetical protein